MKKKSKHKPVPADFQRLQKSALVRKYRKTILFNEKELSAINMYCDKYNIRSKSSFFRGVIISHILNQIDENYPKLF
ncbi:MAG: hypothetical protein PHD11_09655 [Bacteroidales bacterium]|nr:hypothetical protein [Bacteroidales bacterium]MDD4670428.1 hypothetical protein [Bacteroidales bacterium]